MRASRLAVEQCERTRVEGYSAKVHVQGTEAFGGSQRFRKRFRVQK